MIFIAPYGVHFFCHRCIVSTTVGFWILPADQAIFLLFSIKNFVV